MTTNNPEPIVTGDDLFALCERLFPICRSITGRGVRETLSILSEQIDLSIYEVPSNKPVFDWTVPQEWNINAAWVENAQGKRVIDFADNNLHVVSYSEPVDAVMSLKELKEHLYSIPEQPQVIPYRTSYYQRNWGFCVTQEHADSLEDGDYRVVIDSEFSDGSLTYGEYFIPGETDNEILISTHICHPSLANDNLSGITVATHLAEHFKDCKPKNGLRFIFIPGTIGAVTWLAENESKLSNIVGAIVLSGIGDPGPLTYKASRYGKGIFDRLFSKELEGLPGATVRPFIPYGYDERQFCSPGIGLHAGCLMRTPYGEYDAYHSSLDNLDLLSKEALLESYLVCQRVLTDASLVSAYINQKPNCEPQLGKYGLYDNVGGDNQTRNFQLALLWLLNYSDGEHSTLDIHEQSGISLAELDMAAQALQKADLLRYSSED